jgi:DNA-binding NarL/FixJ family response regulator
MDLHLEDGSDPTETIARLAQAGHHVVVLTSEMRPVPIRGAIRAGAIGLCLKSDEPDLIVHVLRSAAAGAFSVSSDLAFVLMTDAELTAKLAPREIEALQLLADGVPRKSVGERMDPPVAMSTVVTYLNRACARYREMGVDVQSPRDAVRAAIQDGYFDSPEI